MPSPSGFSQATSFDINISELSDNEKSLFIGTKWGNSGLGNSASITYSFPTSSSSLFWSSDYTDDPSSETAQGFSSLNTSERETFRAAIQAWENVANISITELSNETFTNVGDIRVAYTTSPYITSSLAYAYTPATVSYGGDVWLNDNGYNFSTNEFKQLLLHEIGHALGLDHPFEDGSNKTYTIDSNLDYFKYTVMSYSAVPNQLDLGDSSLYPNTPMLLDIQALQYIYGANMSYNTGDNTYVFDSETSYYETIWDAGGNDTIQHNGNRDATINLNAGTYSILGKPITLSEFADITQDDNVAIAYGVTIENATGGQGNDTIIGNGANNLIIGNAGDDTMSGGLGNDTYEVTEIEDVINENTNEGIDSVWTAVNGYMLADNVEVLNIRHLNTSGYVFYGNNLDNTIVANNYSSRIISGDGNDTVIGGTAADIINASAGNDTMSGGFGDDVYGVTEVGDIVNENAGEGNDTVWTSVNGYVLADNVEKMVIRPVDTTGYRFYGNDLDNLIFANNYVGFISGGAGNDTIVGGAADDLILDSAGNDTMVGGLGNDLYGVTEAGDFIIEKAGEGIDTVWTSVNGYILADNVENMNIRQVNTAGYTFYGNNLNNTIVANNFTSIIYAGAGNDTIIGGTADDLMVDSAGNDIMTGGLGNDLYGVTEVGDVVNENAGEGIDTVWTSINGYVLADNVENMNIRYVDTTDYVFYGNNLDNTIIANNYATTISSDHGNDTVIGGAADDTISGGNGNDSLTGGLGSDVFQWSLADKGANNNPDIDVITDFSTVQNDVLDLRDLLVGVSADVNTLANFLDVTTSGGNTEVRISSTGGFSAGIYNAASEDARIQLSNTDLFTDTGTASETALLQNLIDNNQLLIG